MILAPATEIYTETHRILSVIFVGVLILSTLIGISLAVAAVIIH